MKKRKFFQSSSLVFVIFTLSACGGNDSGDVSENSGTTGSAFTKNNYEVVAETAFSLLTSSTVFRETESGSIESMSLRIQALTPMIQGDIECDEGSVTYNSSFQENEELTDGDKFDISYNSCLSLVVRGDGSTEFKDGRYQVEFSLTGDYFRGGIGTYRSYSEYQSFSYRMNNAIKQSYSYETLLDGDITEEGERTATSNRWKVSHKKYLYSHSEILDDFFLDSLLISDGSKEWLDNVAEGTYSLQHKGSYDLTISLYSREFYSGKFSYKVNSNLTGQLDALGFNGRLGPSEGIIKLSDNQSLAVILLMVSDNGVLVELDLNGDGLSEFTSNF